jgi:hypothetical protein
MKVGTDSRSLIHKQRFPIAPALAPGGKAAACTAVFAFLLAAGLPIAAQAQTGTLVFSSGYEPATALLAPGDCWATPSGCWQKITGTDITTNYPWPPNVWGGGSTYGGGGVFQLIADVPGVTASTVGDYLFNQIVNVQGHTGTWTNQAVYSQITKGPNGQNLAGTVATQNIFQLFPAFEGGDLYISYWLKFQPGMTKNMIGLDPTGPGVYSNGGTWRSFFGFKTGASAPAGGFPGNDGDYRVEAYVLTGCHPGLTQRQIPPCVGINPNPQPFWGVVGDNNAGCDPSLCPPTNQWVETNTAVPVPDDGQWSKVEVFWHRSSGADGRVWIAINGAVICDHRGPNVGGASLSPRPINRIMISPLYSGGRFPIYQWVDDIQIWDRGFPPCTSVDACWDPPYAPH